jgi:hypothetical protein
MIWWVVLAFASPFEFKETPGEILELRENGKAAFVYNYGMQLATGAPEDRRRSSYVHPVYTPRGIAVTDDFPRDHWHHRGVFWAWPIVRAGGERYDNWTIKGLLTKFIRFTNRNASADSAELGVESGWYAGDKQIAREHVRIVAYPAKGASRTIAFELTFDATSAPVEIEGDPTNDKGYGGFSVRFAKREGTVITTDRGREAKDTDMVPHAWAELAATFEGGPAALRIDIDPSNPGAPNGWCLRHYGFLGVNYPGRTPLVLQPGKPLTLKYRVTLSDR